MREFPKILDANFDVDPQQVFFIVPQFHKEPVESRGFRSCRASF